MKEIIILLGCLAALIACKPSKQKKTFLVTDTLRIKTDSIFIGVGKQNAFLNSSNNIAISSMFADSSLQTKIDSILQHSMRKYNANFGQVILMEVKTGRIKAIAGNSYPQKSCLLRPISILAALETQKIKLSDTINVGNGAYQIDESTILDHNQYNGGYGNITIEQGLAYQSNVATYKTIKKAFPQDQDYYNMLNSMGVNCRHINLLMDSIEPIQALTIYNAIANDGIMVKPLFDNDNVTVINSQIADPININSIKEAMRYTIIHGLGVDANAEYVSVSGIPSITPLENNQSLTEFCGYFPSDNPQYSCVVSINKKGVPVREIMASDIFRQIANMLTIDKYIDLFDGEFLKPKEESYYYIAPDSRRFEINSQSNIDSIIVQLMGTEIAEKILKSDRELATLMLYLAYFEQTDIETDIKWMDKYRKELCNYFDTNNLGGKSTSVYAKADSVIEAARRLWDVDEKDPIMYGTIINMECNRLIFQQYNEYVQLLKICGTRKQEILLKNELEAWYELASLIKDLRYNFAKLYYWGGSIHRYFIFSENPEILKSHISLYQKEREWLTNRTNGYENEMGVYIECGKDALLNSSQIALNNIINDDSDLIFGTLSYQEEHYEQILDNTKKDVLELPHRVDKWIKARELWGDEMCTDFSRQSYKRNTGAVLISLAHIISVIDNR